MDIDRRVKTEVLFKNKDMKETVCYCVCKINKLNNNEMILFKCNNNECDFNEHKFNEIVDKLKIEKKKEDREQFIEKVFSYFPDKIYISIGLFFLLDFHYGFLLDKINIYNIIYYG